MRRSATLSHCLLLVGLAGSLALGACSDSSATGATDPGGGDRGASAPEGGGPARGGGKARAPQAGPESAKLAHQAGLQQLLLGEPVKAEAEFRRAIELDPELADAHYQLGRLLVALSSQNVGSNTRDLDVLDQGIASLKRALELAPENDDYAYWVGRAYHIEEKFDQATAFLQQAVQLRPANAEAHKRLGLVYLDQGETDQARQEFEACLQHDPAFPGASFQLGQTLELLDDLEGARAAYQRAIESDPTVPEPYGALSKLLARNGEEEAARKAEEQYAAWKEYDEKLKKRMMMVNQNPNDAAALRRLGKMYLDVHKWADAQEWFLKAIHLDPRDAESHLYCGIARRELGDYEAATNHLKEAEFLAPEYLDPKLELLRLYVLTEDQDSLEALITSVETEAAQDADSLEALGDACAAAGRQQDAQRLRGKAAALRQDQGK